MIPKNIKKIPLVVLLEGCGAGSKLLQNYFDNHQNILMTPEYNLMYFFQHWDESKKIINLKKKIRFIISKHKPILSVSKKKITSSKLESKIFNLIKDEKINSKNFLLAFHIAYSECLGQNIKKKKIFFYHIHVNSYLKYLLKDFKKIKIIYMVRELEINFSRRIKNSMNNINLKRFNYTDAILINLKSYLELLILYSKFIFFNKFEYFNQTIFVSFSNLKKNKKKVLKKISSFIGIKYLSAMNKPTVNGEPWSVKENLKDKVTSIHYYEKKWLQTLFHKFNSRISDQKSKYKHQDYFRALLYINLPTAYEFKNLLNFFNINFIIYYLNKLKQETYKNKHYNLEKNSFYKYKWSNRFVPVKFLNKINQLIYLNFLGKKIFFIIKLFFIPLGVLLIIFFYIFRVILCYLLLIYNPFFKKKFPKIL